MGPLSCLRQSAARAARARARALSAVAAVAGALLAEARARACRRKRARRWRLENHARDPEHRLVADLRLEARAGPQDGARRRDRARSAAGRYAGERENA